MQENKKLARLDPKIAIESAAELKRCAIVFRGQLLKRGDTRDGDLKQYCEKLESLSSQLIQSASLAKTDLELAMANYDSTPYVVRA